MSNTVKSAEQETQKNKGGGCITVLFPGIFLVAGLAVMVFVGLKPLFHYWQAGGWDRVPATVLSSSLQSSRSDGSTTYSVSAHYRYDYQGRRYTSHAVSLYGGSDNFDDYWQRLAGRLERARNQGKTVLAWVNPGNPSEAYLDRTLRWGSLLFGLAFGGVFALVGGGLMFLLNRGSKDKTALAEGGEYSSKEKSGHWFLVGFGAIFILLPSPAYVAVWDKVGRGDFAILLVLLFPAVGAGIAYAGWKMRSNYRFFGPTPLTLDPEPGHAGGQVGGAIRLGRSLARDADLDVWLSCIRGRESGSGKDRRTVEDILWQTDQRAYCQPVQQGSELLFCFDVPADQPASSGSGRNYICWRVELEGKVDGRTLKRSWDIPVIAGEAGSRYRLPESHVMAEQRERQVEALESANQQIRVEQTAQGLHLESRPGRHLGMKLALLVFGGIFAAVGTGLFIAAASEGLMLYLMGSIFGLIGYAIVGSTLFTLGRGLEAWIRGGEVRSLRRWLGIPLFTRNGQLLRAEQLVLKTGMSSTSNGRKTEYMTLVAEVDGKTIRLAEGIAGREAGEALREAVLRTLRLV
ncbi:MAG: DUF3592 domain-containing protein [Pseudomonadota bacterium]|nr:DUF3592 domain-containing protein [Pseudomonadota bacterium]